MHDGILAPINQIAIERLTYIAERRFGLAEVVVERNRRNSDPGQCQQRNCRTQPPCASCWRCSHGSLHPLFSARSESGNTPSWRLPLGNSHVGKCCIPDFLHCSFTLCV